MEMGRMTGDEVTVEERWREVEWKGMNRFVFLLVTQNNLSGLFGEGFDLWSANCASSSPTFFFFFSYCSWLP